MAVLHTGASVLAEGSGPILLALARRLSARGQGIALLGMEAVKLASTLDRDGASYECLNADPKDRAQVELLTELAERRLGGVNHLICGLPETASGVPLRDSTFVDWITHVEVPLATLLALSQGTFPRLAKNKGAILFLQPAYMTGAFNDCAMHAAFQEALTSLVKCLGREFALAGVRVNAVTTGERSSYESDSNGVSCAPQQAAALADFLLDKRAEYITGQVIQTL